MAGNVIKEFLVSLGFEINDSQFNKFTKGIASATVQVAKLGAAAIAAAAGVFYGIAKIADSYDALGDLGNRVNATVAEIEELGYVAKLTGSSVEAANSSLEGLSQTMGLAAMGMGRGLEVFKKLGIQVKDSNGKLKSTAEVMDEIGVKIKGLERGQQIAILSRLGIDPTMIEAVTGNTAELRAEFQQLYKTVGLDSNKAAEESGKFNDSLDRLGFTLSTIYKAVGVKFIPKLTEGMDRLRKAIVQQVPQIIAGFEPIIRMILRVGEFFLTLALRVLSLFAKLNAATSGWASYILAALAAWRLLNLGFLATPIGMVIGLAVAIAALIDDFLTWKEGGDSLIDWKAWEPAINAAIAGITALGNVIQNVFMGAVNIVAALISLLTGDFSGAWGFVGKAIQNVLGVFSSALDYLSKIGGFITAIGSGINQTFAKVPNGAKPAGGGVNMNQSTQISVNGSTNPESTARAVGGAQNMVNAGMARDMRGAVR